MLPYNKYIDVNLRYDEYNQELGINRISKRLLNNDLYLQNMIEVAINGDIVELRVANSEDTKGQIATDKGIVPKYVLSLSASDYDIIVGNVDNRYVTADLYKQYIDSKRSPTLWVDLSIGSSFVYKHVPSSDNVLEKAIEFIHDYDAPDNTLMYVRFVYTHKWTTTYRHWLHKKKQKHYEDFMYQDTFERKNGEWKFLRRRKSNRI